MELESALKTDSRTVMLSCIRLSLNVV